MKWFHTKWLFSFCVIILDSAWFTEKKKKSTHTILEQELKWGKEKSTFFFLIKNNSMKVG